MDAPLRQRTTSARIPTSAGTFHLYHYTNGRDDKEHLALVMGEVKDGEGILVRVHSECMTGDVFGSLRCDCGEQLQAAMQHIAIEHLRAQGIQIVDRVPLEPNILPENAAYLETKVRRMRHLLRLPAAAPANVTGQQLPTELALRVAALRQRAHAYAEERGLPFVTLSYAQSLDGSIAAERGQPLALRGPLSLTLTHALRAAHDAILVGIGTVLADDPRLTVIRSRWL